MNSSRYPLYAVAIVAAGALALWMGLSPFFLIVLLACPLMMFVMMRGGMHDGGHGEHGGANTPRGTEPGSQPTRPSDLDGSHGRIDQP